VLLPTYSVEPWRGGVLYGWCLFAVLFCSAVDSPGGGMGVCGIVGVAAAVIACAGATENMPACDDVVGVTLTIWTFIPSTSAAGRMGVSLMALVTCRSWMSNE